MTIGRAESFRWGACFALALCFHGAGAVALVAKWNEDSDLAANAPLIMIDLAPVAAAPETVPNDLPPDPVATRQEEPEPEPVKPVEKVELPPAQAPDVTLPPPPPKKVEKPKEKKPKAKSIARAPSAADPHAERASAPTAGASGDPRLRYRTGGRNWCHGSNATSVIRPKPSHAAKPALPNSPSRSIAAAAFITRASCTALAPACSIAKHSRLWNARNRCHRHRRKFPARRSQSWCRSATTRARHIVFN